MSCEIDSHRCSTIHMVSNFFQFPTTTALIYNRIFVNFWAMVMPAINITLKNKSKIWIRPVVPKKKLFCLAIILSLVFLISGCATTKNYEKVLDTWMGSTADDLVNSWGPPQNSYTRNDGGKVLEYAKQSSFKIGGFTYSTPVTTQHTGSLNTLRGGTYNYSGTSTTYEERQVPVQTFTTSCVTRFIVDKNDTIRSWSWEGDACVAKAPLVTNKPSKYHVPGFNLLRYGLTKDEVFVLMGRPVSIENNSKDSVLWYYSKDTENGPYVRFVNGAVFTWQP